MGASRDVPLCIFCGHGEDDMSSPRAIWRAGIEPKSGAAPTLDTVLEIGYLTSS
jgi:hypothetical protein